MGTSVVAGPMVICQTLGLRPTPRLGVGGAVLLVQGLLGCLANHIISRESARVGAGSYHDLMDSVFGKPDARAVAAAQVVNSIGKLVVWLIILADIIVGRSGGFVGPVKTPVQPQQLWSSSFSCNATAATTPGGSKIA